MQDSLKAWGISKEVLGRFFSESFDPFFNYSIETFLKQYVEDFLYKTSEIFEKSRGEISVALHARFSKKKKMPVNSGGIPGGVFKQNVKKLYKDFLKKSLKNILGVFLEESLSKFSLKSLGDFLKGFSEDFLKPHPLRNSEEIFEGFSKGIPGEFFVRLTGQIYGNPGRNFFRNSWENFRNNMHDFLK